MEQEDPMPPFWIPNTDRRHLRRSYSLLQTSTSLLVLFLVVALVFSLVVLPTLRSFASNVFRPQAVKQGWDYLNIVLVLFAVVCGFLTRNDTGETRTPRFVDRRSFSNPETPPPWYEYPNRPFNRLRSFGSQPDLRQHSSWVAADERFRFYDDTHLLLRHRSLRPDAEEELVIENVATVTSVEISALPPQQTDPAPEKPPSPSRSPSPLPSQSQSTSPPAPQSQSPPPSRSPSPPPVTRRKAIRRNAKPRYQSEVIETPKTNDSAAENSQLPPPSPPPPPPPPPPPRQLLTAAKKKKRGIATKEFLTSLRGKKKKQRQRSVDNFESILNSELSRLAPQPPPSPPPPPPPSVFNSLFSSKKSKHKNRYLDTHPVAIQKPGLSNKREHSYYSLEDKRVMNTGNESPLIPIPPSPPPPPFKLPAWKFRVQGDFVRVDSIGSSRSGSPDLDEVVESPTSQDETSQSNSPCAPDGDEPATATASANPLFCPSPDVDTKAHNFIQNFRAGLRKANMNSMKGIGRSNLGPSPIP